MERLTHSPRPARHLAGPFRPQLQKLCRRLGFESSQGDCGGGSSHASSWGFGYAGGAGRCSWPWTAGKRRSSSAARKAVDAGAVARPGTSRGGRSVRTLGGVNVNSSCRRRRELQGIAMVEGGMRSRVVPSQCGGRARDDAPREVDDDVCWDGRQKFPVAALRSRPRSPAGARVSGTV